MLREKEVVFIKCVPRVTESNPVGINMDTIKNSFINKPYGGGHC